MPTIAGEAKSAGGIETPEQQTWSWNPVEDVANVGSDVVGWIAGPPGDPGRIRRAAQRVENLSARYDADRRAIDEAVGELLRTWQGDSAAAFRAKWNCGIGIAAPTAILSNARQQLDEFAKKLNDYADQLKHAQHEHWIQTALTVGLTVVNVAQLGLDPGTDAAEVGETTVAVVSARLANFGTLAFREAAIDGFSDLFAQAGADVWDRTDRGFDRTGDHAVGLFDPMELVVSAAGGAVGGAMLAGTARVVSNLLQRVGGGAGGIQSVDDVVVHPGRLSGKSPEEVQNAIGNSPGWREESLGRGTHQGQGWALREYDSSGNRTGRLIRWHPGGGRHGPHPYWRVSSPGGGKSEWIPAAPSDTADHQAEDSTHG